MKAPILDEHCTIVLVEYHKHINVATKIISDLPVS